MTTFKKCGKPVHLYPHPDRPCDHLCELPEHIGVDHSMLIPIVVEQTTVDHETPQQEAERLYPCELLAFCAEDDTHDGLCQRHPRHFNHLLIEIKRRQQAETCRTCVGIPPTSGKSCVCGGTGKRDDETTNLRVALMETEAKLAGAQEKLAAYRERNAMLAAELSRLRRIEATADRMRKNDGLGASGAIQTARSWWAEQERQQRPFYDHIDKCERCQEEPFNLCPTGARLLKQATESVSGLLLGDKRP